MKPLTTNEALDMKGLAPMYETYSLAQCWNMDARDVAASYVEGLSVPMPIDGDAMARAAAAQRTADAAWQRHYDQEGPAVPDLVTVAALDRDAYRAHLEAVAGVDLLTLEPTC